MLRLLMPIVLAFALSAQAETYDWQLKRDRDGIQVYTCKVAGSSFKAVKAVTEIDVSLSSVVALLRDAQACPKWADRCGQSYVYEQVDTMEEYIYTRNAMPWPISDRDVLAHVVWRQNPTDLSVIMISRATADKMPKTKGVVRLVEARVEWQIKPLAQARVQLTTLAHINPGGPLPAWVTNMLLVDSPHKTFKNLKKTVVTEPYKSARLGYLQEPE